MLNCTLYKYDWNLKINNIFSLMERHKSAKKWEPLNLLMKAVLYS